MYAKRSNSRNRNEISRNGYESKRGRRDNSRDSRSFQKFKRKRSYSYTSTTSSDIDDSVGHFQAVKGDIVNKRYTIENELGTGTFGKVFYCKDSKHNDFIALKVIRKISRYVDSAKIEAKILEQVYNKQKELGSNLCMKMYSKFLLNGYFFMVCEPLGTSMYQYVKDNNYCGLPLNYVLEVAKQLLEAMIFLEKIKLVHTDLKLENILFVNPNSVTSTVEFRGCMRTIRLPASTQIKVIDFGGATFEDDKDKSTIINTRQYRGPEVTLELGWSFASDVWSVGCILAEIYDGELLFPTHDDIEHLAMMEQRLGTSFSREVVARSPVYARYFHRDGALRLEELSPKDRKYIAGLDVIDDMLNAREGDDNCGLKELLKGLLCLDPSERLKPKDALDSRVFNPTN